MEESVASRLMAGEWVELGNGAKARRLSPREQSGATKRARTRFALWGAAKDLFSERGWDGTRMEDVAKEAGYSVKTLYNHYPTKRALLLEIYFRNAALAQEDGQHLLEEGRTPLEVANFAITMFAKYVSGNRKLTAAAVAAFHDQKLEWPELGDHDLPEDRGLPVLIAILSDLIDLGREDGVIKAGPPSFELATYHVMGLMMTATMHPDMEAESLIRLAQSQLQSALETQRGLTGPSK